jgi:hypothetical protein
LRRTTGKKLSQRTINQKRSAKKENITRDGRKPQLPSSAPARAEQTTAAAHTLPIPSLPTHFNKAACHFNTQIFSSSAQTAPIPQPKKDAYPRLRSPPLTPKSILNGQNPSHYPYPRHSPLVKASLTNPPSYLLLKRNQKIPSRPS